MAILGAILSGLGTALFVATAYAGLESPTGDSNVFDAIMAVVMFLVFVMCVAAQVIESVASRINRDA